LFGLQVTKGSPNWLLSQIQVWYDTTNAMGDVPLAKMVEFMQWADLVTTPQVLTPAVYGAYGYSPDISIPVDEAANGPLNAICCAWNRVTPACYVSDFLWSQII
jgi:hypothetical protein